MTVVDLDPVRLVQAQHDGCRGAPQLFDPFAAVMLLGLDAILSGQTADLPNGVQRYPRPLEERVARALATGSA